MVAKSGRLELRSERGRELIGGIWLLQGSLYMCS
jgi:hypothetical protein